MSPNSVIPHQQCPALPRATAPRQLHMPGTLAAPHCPPWQHKQVLPSSNEVDHTAPPISTCLERLDSGSLVKATYLLCQVSRLIFILHTTAASPDRKRVHRGTMFRLELTLKAPVPRENVCTSIRAV